MKQQIIEHGENLKAIFNLDADPYKLSSKVHSLEVRAHKLSTDYCNGNIDMAEWDVETESLLKKLDKILGFEKKNIPVFVNGDARGYALKIRDQYVKNNDLKIHKDWGGYGILSPEFDGTI
jgi:hypothetical protein